MKSLRTASEIQSAILLQSQDKLPWRTVICVRRQLPDWWDIAKQKHSRIKFIHTPLCASKEPRFALGLWRFIRGTLPRCDGPVLLFCSEGRHRSGAVAALTQHGWIRATIAYLRRAGFRARLKELAISLILEKRLREITRSNQKCG